MDTLAVVNCGAVNVRVQVFVPVTLFSGFGCKPGLESRGHVATLANFLRTCQTVPRSHQQRVKLPVSPRPCQGSFSSATAGVTWHPAGLVCIPVTISKLGFPS